LEEGDHHKYPGRAKVPVEALANLAADAVVEPAVAVVVEPAVAADAAALVVVVAVAVAAAEPAAEPAAVAEVQELGDFVAGHHCHQTLMWEMEEG